MAGSRRSAVFDVRPGEGRRLLVMGGAMAALLAAHTIAETARDAMFLRAVPSTYLSIVYVALAGLALVALKANQALIQRVGRRHALVSTLMAAAYGTAMFYILGAGPMMAFGLYLWTGLLGTIIIVQFWLLAGSAFTTSEGKRLFGLVAAMGALGAFLGAAAAGAAVILVDVEKLLPIASAFYLIGGLLLVRDHEAPIAIANRRVRPGTVHGPVRLRDQPYVARLAALAVLATVAAVISDYLLKTTAVVELGADALPEFFATYNAAVSILSLVLQLIGATFILRRAGVLGAITLLPLALVLGGGATLLTASAFFVIVLTKGADATLKNSVNRVASELLWMPVNSDVRAAVREPLDSVVSRIVQAATAALLLGLGLLGLATPRVLAAVLVGAALVWLVVAASLRSRYLSQLRTALMRPAFETDQDLDVESLEIVVEALSSLDDRRVIAAIQVLQRHNRARLIPALLLRHDSSEVLSYALDAIAVPGRTDWIPLTKRLLASDHPVVRIAAIRALARAGERDAIRRGLADPDPVVRATAVFWDAHTGDATDLLHDRAVAVLLASDDDDAETVRRMLIEAIRDDGDERWAPVLLELARAAESDMIEPLARAIERLPDPRFLPILIDRLGMRAGRSHVRAALVAIGEPALEAVKAALDDARTPPRIRLHLPTTLALFGTQRAGDALIARLVDEKSGAIRYRLLRAIARLAIHHEVEFDTRTLLDEVGHHLREHFRLLGLFVGITREPRARRPTPPVEGTDEHPAKAIIELPDTRVAITRSSRAAIELPDPETIELPADTAASRESLDLVRGLLRDKISQARDRVFLVLEALHPRDDVRSIERALASQDKAARAHALEFLDTLTRSPIYQDAPDTRAAILVACEDLPPAEQARRVPNLADVARTPAAAITRMLRDSDSLLAACAAYHALQLGPSALADRVMAIAQERPLLAPLGLAPADREEPAGLALEPAGA